MTIIGNSVLLVPGRRLAVSLWLILPLCLLLLGGCASPPPPTVTLDYQQLQNRLASLENWQIKGKFGFKSPQQRPKSAGLFWRQQQQRYQLSLNTVLGTSILNLQGEPNQATLTADDETHTGSSASELIWQMTGWQLPVEHLSTWIKGQQLAGDRVRLSEQGWLSQLNPGCAGCEGWQIDYSDVQKVEGFWLPHNIQLSNFATQVKITLRINTWTIKQ